LWLDEKTHIQLTEHDRNQIYLLLEDKYSLRKIAKAIGRSVSTVSDEIQRNSVDGKYNPKKAQHKAYVRRKDSKFQGKKIVAHPKLRDSVEVKLLEGRSPESVAGRITKQETELPSISADSIERFLKSPYGRVIEYKRSQLKKAQKHKKRTKRKAVTKLSERTFIDDRPEVINTRSRVGDAEADFIISGKDGKGILLTVADRKLRVGFIEKILPVTIPNVHRAFQRIHKRFPELLSITTDNDILLRYHKDLETLFGIPIYFCHPYHSWEKGTIENINGEIRKYVPKSSNISKYTRPYLKQVELKINDRYMALLDFATPQEALDKHRMTIKKNKASSD
jgi:IS30 family transposase